MNNVYRCHKCGTYIFTTYCAKCKKYISELEFYNLFDHNNPFKDIFGEFGKKEDNEQTEDRE